MRCSIFLFLIALSAAGARAELLLAPASSTLAPGGRIEVTLFVANDSAEERSFDLPPRLTLGPRGRTGSPVVVLEATEPQPAQVRLAPGAFHRVRYAGTLPEGLTGEIVLDPVDFKGQPLAFIAATPAGTPPGEERPAAPAEGSSQAQTPPPGAEFDPEASRFTSAFSAYEPNYFSAGSSGPTNARFQVSFKFRFFNPNTKTPFLEQIFFGYSQSSIWDLSSASKSFRDSSYRPSLFYLNDSISQWKYRDTKLGLQGGFEHESNGKDGTSSRSLNILFVRPTLTFPLKDNYFVALSPKIYGYLEKEENPDIAEYRGYVDFLIKAGRRDGFQLATTMRKGTRAETFSIQLDGTYPLKEPSLGNLGGYLHLQYFYGYGENLIDYNQKERPQFRIGLMFTR